MKDIRFRVWHLKEKKMYYRGYQKFFYALLCDDDHGKNEGRGIPSKRAFYGDCIFLESTSLYDIYQREIYEGDVVRVTVQGTVFEGLIEAVPDSFGSSKTHPLAPLLKKHGFSKESGKLGDLSRIKIEVIGNEYALEGSRNHDA